VIFNVPSKLATSELGLPHKSRKKAINSKLNTILKTAELNKIKLEVYLQCLHPFNSNSRLITEAIINIGKFRPTQTEVLIHTIY